MSTVRVEVGGKIRSLIFIAQGKHHAYFNVQKVSIVSNVLPCYIDGLLL